MGVFRAILKSLLNELFSLLYSMVDRGECDKLPPETFEQIREMVHPVNTVSADGARKHLGISRTQFYQCKVNKLGKKVKGFKELVYYLSDLDEFNKQIKETGKNKKML
jgi:hypothetical protein